MDSSPNIRVVRRLLSALHDRDEEAVAAELHPEIEALGARGRKRGIDEVVGWAKPTSDGHLVSSVVEDEILDVGEEWVAVGARRIWTWVESGEQADVEGFGVLYRIRDGKVVSWDQTFGSIADAIAGIPAS